MHFLRNNTSVQRDASRVITGIEFAVSLFVKHMRNELRKIWDRNIRELSFSLLPFMLARML